MLLQNLRAKVGARLNGDKEAGFTLIELLVVMLILGILAAIALPAFFNQKNKATDSKAKENAHSAQVAMETCGTEAASQADPYGTCSATALHNIEPTLPDNSGSEKLATEVSPTLPVKSYKVTVTSTTGNKFSIARSDTGALSYPCEIPTATSDHGGCNVTSGTTGTWTS